MIRDRDQSLQNWEILKSLILFTLGTDRESFENAITPSFLQGAGKLNQQIISRARFLRLGDRGRWTHGQGSSAWNGRATAEYWKMVRDSRAVCYVNFELALSSQDGKVDD